VADIRGTDLIQSAAHDGMAMITVFAQPRALVSRLRRHLVGRDFATVDHEVEFERSVREALVGVVAVGKLDAGTVRWLCQSHPADSLAQFVLVADLSPCAVRAVLGADHDHLRVVWWEEVDGMLPEVLDDVSGDPLAALCASLLGRHDLSPVLQRVVREACLSPTPPPTVQELSERTEVRPRTLYDHWQTELPGCLPKDLLSWAVLLRALTAGGHRRWTDVASKLAVHPRTLERLSLRVVGVPLAVAASDGRTVWRAFQRWAGTWMWAVSASRIDSGRPHTRHTSVA
jgi:hypothetical protein